MTDQGRYEAFVRHFARGQAQVMADIRSLVHDRTTADSRTSCPHRENTGIGRLEAGVAVEPNLGFGSDRQRRRIRSARQTLAGRHLCGTAAVSRRPRSPSREPRAEGMRADSLLYQAFCVSGL